MMNMRNIQVGSESSWLPAESGKYRTFLKMCAVGGGGTQDRGQRVEVRAEIPDENFENEILDSLNFKYRWTSRPTSHQHFYGFSIESKHRS